MLLLTEGKEQIFFFSPHQNELNFQGEIVQQEYSATVFESHI